MSIEDFGGVGDGKTSNTESFRRAIRYMQRFRDRGGSQLNIPKGRWLTGSFNLTSDFTLFLQQGAVILASQVPLLTVIYTFFLYVHFLVFLGFVLFLKKISFWTLILCVLFLIFIWFMYLF